MDASTTATTMAAIDLQTPVVALGTTIGSLFTKMFDALTALIPVLLPVLGVLALFLVFRYGRTILRLVKGMFSSSSK